MRTKEEKSTGNIGLPVDEAYKALRTNIQFSSFDDRIQTVVVTSSVSGEGKSTTAINLALTMAEAGHRTILLDCDLRKPRVHKVFGVSNLKGLSNVLIGELAIYDALYETQVDNMEAENLYVLTSGEKPPNPSELLGSSKMKNFVALLKKEFDYIILDTPPVLLVTDAQILSQYADGCLLVVSSGKSQIEQAKKAKSLLEMVNAKILGVVLNKVNYKKSGQYYDYAYEDKKSV